MQKTRAGNRSSDAGSVCLWVMGLAAGRLEEVLTAVLSAQDVTIDVLDRFPQVFATISPHPLCSTPGNLTPLIDRELNAIEGLVWGLGSEPLEVQVGQLLLSRRLTVATAESCTGGLLAHKLISMSGSSGYFLAGLVTYSNQSKTQWLEVPEQMLLEHGAVSSQVATWMAETVREKAGADLGVSTTGVAGPTGGTPAKPVGTVYMAAASSLGTAVVRRRFSGDRDAVRIQSAYQALHMLYRAAMDLVEST